MRKTKKPNKLSKPTQPSLSHDLFHAVKLEPKSTIATENISTITPKEKLESDLGNNLGAETVAILSQRLKKTLEQNFGEIRVLGEISGFKRATSGHSYFNLKDVDTNESALLNCFLLKHKLAYQAFAPSDGMTIIATGKISSYSARSNYQLLVDKLELAGVGNLLQILEQRKQQLLQEGLFDPLKKKPLPKFPKTIAIITSETGAVIQDIIHRLKTRFPVHVIIYPVLVQGAGAALEISNGIYNINQLAIDENLRQQWQLPKPDLLIIARGGGSLEDLWAFNEEIVVRACAASKIPTISAIGHETDTTLIDYAADQRAPTPTAAVEIALPQQMQDLIALNQQYQYQLQQCFNRLLEQYQKNLQYLIARLPNPKTLLQQKQQNLQLIWQNYQLRQKYFFEQKSQTLNNLNRILENLSYKKTLQRGFAIVKKSKQQPTGMTTDAVSMIVTSAKDLNQTDLISLHFGDETEAKAKII